MKSCIICPRCGAHIDTPVLLCPRCREPLPLGCDGNCKECATKDPFRRQGAQGPVIPTNKAGS